MLTRRGFSCVAFGISLIATGRVIGATQFYLLGSAALLLCLVALIYVQARRFDIDIARVANATRIHVGEGASITLRLSNKKRIPTPPLVVRDNIANWGQARHLAEPISSKSVLEATYSVPTPRRGLITFGPIEVAAIDPFGLAVRSQFHQVKSTLLVLPRIVPLIAPSLSGRAEVSRQLQHRTQTGDNDFALREYVNGDDARLIHWRSSARRGTLLLREPYEVSSATCTIVFDNTSPTSPGRFEDMLTLCASIVTSASRQSVPVRLMFTDGSQMLSANSPDQSFLLLEALALCEQKQVDYQAMGIAPTEESMIIITSDPKGFATQFPTILLSQNKNTLCLFASFGDEPVSIPRASVVQFTSSTPLALHWNKQTALLGAMGSRW